MPGMQQLLFRGLSAAGRCWRASGHKERKRQRYVLFAPGRRTCQAWGPCKQCRKRPSRLTGCSPRATTAPAFPSRCAPAMTPAPVPPPATPSGPRRRVSWGSTVHLRRGGASRSASTMWSGSVRYAPSGQARGHARLLRCAWCGESNCMNHAFATAAAQLWELAPATLHPCTVPLRHPHSNSARACTWDAQTFWARTSCAGIQCEGGGG